MAHQSGKQVEQHKKNVQKNAQTAPAVVAEAQGSGPAGPTARLRRLFTHAGFLIPFFAGGGLGYKWVLLLLVGPLEESLAIPRLWPWGTANRR